MQRSTFVRVPIASAAIFSLPPMYAWPTSIKTTILAMCAALCIIAYTAMAAGFIGLATLVLALL